MKSKKLRFLERLVKMSSWHWIALIFGAQTVGAILVSRFFRVNGSDSFVPICLLVFGMVASLLLGFRYRTRPQGRWVSWFPLTVYALFIFSLSQQSFAGAKLPFKGDYFHPIEFGTLALFLSILWSPLLRRGRVIAFVVSVMASGLAFGFSDELHQAFVPGRDSSLVDVLWDALGLSVGCLLYLLAVRAHGLLSEKFLSAPLGETAGGVEALVRSK